MTVWVYVIDCMFSDKQYVGITAQSLEARLRGHLNEASGGSERLICRAIRKYGPDAFYISPILEVDTWEEACAAEVEWVSALNTKAPNGYNLTDGGESSSGYKLSEETKAKISAFQKCRVRGPHTDETKTKISEACKGRKHTDKTRAKMSASRKGQKLTDAHKVKISEAKKAYDKRKREELEAASAVQPEPLG